MKTYKDLLEKVERVTKQKDIDLSSGEDLSIGIMNLISIEEHLFYTSQKTKDKKYLDIHITPRTSNPVEAITITPLYPDL